MNPTGELDFRVKDKAGVKGDGAHSIYQHFIRRLRRNLPQGRGVQASLNLLETGTGFGEDPLVSFSTVVLRQAIEARSGCMLVEDNVCFGS